MSTIINSYVFNTTNLETELEYSTTPIKSTFKCRVYLKLSVNSLSDAVKYTFFGFGNNAFTLNGTTYQFNKYTNNTIYSYDNVVDNNPTGLYKYSSGGSYESAVKFDNSPSGSIYGMTVVVYEGNIDIDYNQDGTLTLDLAVNDKFQRDNAFNITIPVEKASNGHIKINGNWKNACIWKKINGSWKRGELWKKINGVWKKGT